MKLKSEIAELGSIQLPLVIIGVSKEAKEDSLIEAIQDPLKGLIKDVIALNDFTGKKGKDCPDLHS